MLSIISVEISEQETYTKTRSTYMAYTRSVAAAARAVNLTREVPTAPPENKRKQNYTTSSRTRRSRRAKSAAIRASAQRSAATKNAHKKKRTFGEKIQDVLKDIKDVVSGAVHVQPTFKPKHLHDTPTKVTRHTAHAHKGVNTRSSSRRR